MDTNDPTHDDATTAPAPPDLAALIADGSHWRAEARRFEAQSKSLHAQLSDAATLDAATLDAIRADAHAEAAATYGRQLVHAAIRAAAADRSPDAVEALIECVDPSRFTASTGMPDLPRIAAWIEAVIPTANTAPARPTVVALDVRELLARATT